MISRAERIDQMAGKLAHKGGGMTYPQCKSCGNELTQEESYNGVCDNCKLMYKEVSQVGK